MRMPHLFRIRRAAVVVACFGWALTMTGCQHPLAQRPSGQWTPTRVLVDQADGSEARVRPVTKSGFYALAREWNAQGRVDADAARPGQLIETYLDRGELLGFRRIASGPPSGPGSDQVVAVFGSQQITVHLDPGVHHVWYRERGQWSDPGATTFLLGVLGVVLLVGLVVLVANSDDSSVNVNIN